MAKKYISTISDGENDYTIMDEEARASIKPSASSDTCESIITELT